MAPLLAGASNFRWIVALQKFAAPATGEFLLPQKTFDNQRRHQTTTFLHNPSGNIRNIRIRDPKIVDLMTPYSVRPRLPESIVPKECRYPPEAPPWPYREKSYFWYHKFWDTTTKRFDENTKIITVEGNIGSGADKFAKDLAEVLDFHYIPAPTMENVIINGYGQDMRQFYHLFPECYQLFDEEMFYTAPTHRNAIIYAFLLYALKSEAYVNAVAHVLNTGQGVVIERSPYTDLAFVEAMYNKGFLGDRYADYYPTLRLMSLHEMKLYPHLFVYVDCPVSQCLENIKKQGKSYKNNGKVIDYEYLGDIEKYTKNILKDLQKESEVLMFDWTVPGDIDRVAEDIYKIDFSFDMNTSDRYTSWVIRGLESDWHDLRVRMTQKFHALREFCCIHWKIPELCLGHDESKQMRYVLNNVVGPYVQGFNLNRGDKLWNILFPKNDGNMMSNDKWTEYMIRDCFWAVPPQSFIYIRGPVLPNLTEEHFAPRKFDVSQLEHHHSFPQ